MIDDATGAPVLALDGEEEQILALLSLTFRKRISTDALKFIKRASMQWARGEKAIAHFELAYARLPRLETRNEAWPLFYADGLRKLGISPRSLIRHLGFDTRQLGLLKYNVDEPRVPAGNGRESGRWTSGSGGEQYAQNARRPGWPQQLVPLGGNEGGGGGWRGTSGEATGAEDTEGVARTIDILPDRFGQAAQHARDAIQAGRPDILTIDRPGRNANRAAATGKLEKIPGMHLDEYPPAMFKEGGAGASIRAISPHDNMSLGAYIGSCCRGLPNGARVKLRIGE